MKKLIAVQTKKNVEKVRKRLESTSVQLNLPGVFNGEIKSADALSMGHKLLAESNADQALDIANRLLDKVDDVVDIYLLKARALLDLEDLAELQLIISPLVKAAPGNRGVLMAAARYYYLIGEAEKSLALARQSAGKEKNNAEALLHMELCYRYSGETKKAGKILEHCLERTGVAKPEDDVRFRQYSTALLRLANYASFDDERLSELHAICNETNDSLLLAKVAYALATQYRKRKDLDAEVKYLTLANNTGCDVLGLKSKLENIKAIHQTKLSNQIEAFSIQKPQWGAAARNATHSPIFILGLPRSGTTLLEQILGGHTLIGQVGESQAFLSALRAACRAIDPLWSFADYPHGVSRLSEKELTLLIDRFESHQSVLTDKQIYIDKELSNFEYVGLMASLFPNARFIHMDREPMDIFLSCFRNNILGVPETSNLEALAEYYIYMKRLIGYWRSLIPERLMIINYQELVHEPENIAREAASFVGVSFEPSMLKFHERKNIVRTLSVDQVRKSIYTSSVDGWKDYSEALSPARRILESYGVPPGGVAYL